MPYLYGQAPLDGVAANQDLIKRMKGEEGNKPLGESLEGPGYEEQQEQGGVFNKIVRSLADAIASPTQRPGPAGSVMETKEGLDPGSAQVNMLKGNNVIEVGENPMPGIVAHEVGHVDQNAGQGRMKNIMDSIGGTIGAFSRGAFPHDPENGAPREMLAASDGVKALQAAAAQGDPQAIELLEQMGEGQVQRYLDTEGSARQNIANQPDPISFLKKGGR